MYRAPYKSLPLIVVGLLMLAAGSVEAAIHYVNVARPDDSGDGSSWGTAKKTLQAALADAVSGDEIWVAAGTYKPDQGPGVTPGDQTATFQLSSLWGVGIYGGFAGTETLRTERDTTANVTILSGDLAGDDAPVACTGDGECSSLGLKCVDGFCLINGNNTENSFHVVTAGGADTIIDGFTITAGHTQDGKGAGMNIDYPASPWAPGPTILDCTFRGNKAQLGGGGVYIKRTNATLSRCRFIKNSGNFGGGFSGSEMYPTLTDCEFTDNTATSDGGGVYAGGSWSQTHPRLVRCTFSGNSAYQGGGMKIVQAYATLLHCSFAGNSATNGGGFMSEQNGTRAWFANSIFAGNSASLNGGAMYNLLGDSGVDLMNCLLTGNFAGDNGGGIYNTGWVWARDSTFSRNAAITNGGGIHGNHGKNIFNTVFWGNTDTDGLSQDESAQIWTSPATLTIFFSIVQGWTGAYGGGGNSGSDPLFADDDGADNIVGTLDDDLRLTAASPAIDTGSGVALPADTHDLDGEPQGWTRRAVERTAPTAMLLYTLIVLWFARCGHRDYRQPNCPWYRTKRHASFADMLSTLRRESLREQVLSTPPQGRGSQKLRRTVLHAIQYAA